MNYKIENIKTINVSKPLKLDCGQTIKDFPLAYETYGKLNEAKDNAVLVFHALTGDQFVSGINPVTKKEGWWVTWAGMTQSLMGGSWPGRDNWHRLLRSRQPSHLMASPQMSQDC